MSLIPTAHPAAFPLPLGIIPTGTLYPSSRSSIPLTTSHKVPSPPHEISPEYFYNSRFRGIVKLSPAFLVAWIS